MFRKLVMTFFAIALGSYALVGLTGCNTVEGAGKDIKAAGSGIQEEAQEHKKY
jgi:predicted small secreted protein